MTRLAVLVALLSLPPCAARAEVRLTMHDGVVSLMARDATVRQILAEWARVGQTKIVNGEDVAGGPISLQLVEVPEEQALDVILRTVSGYIAAPRLQAAANLSHFDRILITRASAPVATAPPARAANQPGTVPPTRGQQGPNADADEDAPLPNAPPPAPPLSQRVPVPAPRAFPAPVAPNAGDPASNEPAGTPPYNTSSPSAPAGVSTPGMIVQPAPQPGQPGAQPAR